MLIIEPSRVRVSGLVSLFIILVAAAALRFTTASHSLQFDEHASVFFSQQPFGRLWSDWMLRETNPPVYYSLLRAWRAIGGSSDLSIRVPSIIASLSAIALLFHLSRRIYGTTAGVTAAALAGISGRYLYFSEQARSYIFVLCAVLVAVNALITIAAPDADAATRRRALVAYAIAATAAIYLHTTMVLFPAFAFLAFVGTSPRRYWNHPKLLAPFILANLAVLIASTWALRLAVLQLAYGRDNIAAIGLVDTPRFFGYPLQSLFLVNGPEKLATFTALLFVILVGRFAIVDRHREQTRLIASLAGFSLLGFAVIGMFEPIFATRTIFWISGFIVVLAAGALANISKFSLRWIAIGFIIVSLGIDTYRLRATIQEEDWNTPVETVSAQPGALMLVQGEAMALLAQSACERMLSRTCPYTIVAVTVAHDPYDSWAAGLYTGPKVPIMDLQRYTAGHTVFFFRKQWFHNLPLILQRHGLGGGINRTGQLFLGPLPASVVAPR